MRSWESRRCLVLPHEGLTGWVVGRLMRQEFQPVWAAAREPISTQPSHRPAHSRSLERTFSTGRCRQLHHLGHPADCSYSSKTDVPSVRSTGPLSLSLFGTASGRCCQSGQNGLRGCAALLFGGTLAGRLMRAYASLGVPTTGARARRVMGADQLTAKAKSLRELKNFAEATLAAREATRVDPDDANAWWQLGLATHAHQGLGKALGAFKRTTDLAPRFGPGWRMLGLAEAEVGQIQDAKASLRMAYETDSDLTTALNKLAELSLETKDEEQEFWALDHLAAVNNLSSYQCNRLGILYHNKGAYAQAIQFYRRCDGTRRCSRLDQPRTCVVRVGSEPRRRRGRCVASWTTQSILSTSASRRC